MVSRTNGLVRGMFRLLDDGVHELLPLDVCTSARVLDNTVCIKEADTPPSATTEAISTWQVLVDQISQIIAMAMVIHTFVMANNDGF